MLGSTLKLTVCALAVMGGIAPLGQARAAPAAALLIPYCDELSPEDPRLATGECLERDHPGIPDPDPEAGGPR